MITAGDVQFEPESAKIIFLTSSIAIMGAGDSAFHYEITTDVMKEIDLRITAKPEEWLSVREVVDMYIKYRNVAKLKRAEAAILAPLGLDRHSFLSQQNSMHPDLVKDISRDLINFDVPEVEVIVAGVDKYISQSNAHIYSIHNDYVSCDDVIGFRAIGSGARHAEAHFMLARHAWNSDPHATVALTYRAKRDSEVAPGVGTETDMYIIAGLGSRDVIRKEVMERLDREYRKFKLKQAKMHGQIAMEIKRYVDTLPSPPAAQADKPAIEAPPTTPVAQSPDTAVE